MAASRLQLFGTPAFETAVALEPFPLERPFQLLAYLACRGTWTPRDTAASLLWPHRNTATARANLRFVLVQIRRLPLVEGFEARADALRWAVATDVRQFETAVAASDWAAAVGLCSGPLLDGFETDAPAPYTEWLLFERARLHALARDALAARLAQLADAPTDCLALAGHALHADPLDETALSWQLRALGALGRGDDARRAYRDYANRLAADFGIEPAAPLRELAHQIEALASGARHPPALAAKAAGDPGFVGRRAELRRIRDLLLGTDCRVLTICGLGGVGKSALARAAVGDVAAHFPDGAFWVALEDLSSAEQIAQQCATTLGLELRGTDSPQRQLVEHLRTAHALLVFDNAEHLHGFAPQVEALLADCGAVKLLITSRVRIGHPHEWLLSLEGMPVPDADESELDALRSFDAVRLFEARARAQHPAYDAAASAVDAAALARAAEGLPLALELAASRVRILPVAEIARELALSIDLIEPESGGSARGGSLRASFEHSWRMLAPRERRALAACTVLAGSFSRDAALAIADAPLPLLGSLVDKSLLRADGSGRFSMHSLIRQCAAECVEDREDLRRRHAEHFAQLLARYADFGRVDQRRAIAQIEAELAHCRAAWAYAVVQRSGALLARMAPALRHFFEATGRWDEGVEMLEAAPAVVVETDAVNRSTCVVISNALAALLWRRADFALAEQHARTALGLARELEDRGGIKAALNTIGLSLWQVGRYDEARASHEEGLSLARADGDREGAAQFGSNLAIVEKTQGNYARAAALYEEALAIERQSGNQRGLVTRLNNLGNLYRAKGEWSRALRCFDEGLALAQASGLAAPAVFLLVNLALTNIALGDLEAGECYAQRGLDEARTHGEPQIEIMARLALARLATARGDGARADALMHEAMVHAQAMRYTLCELAALNVRAETLAVRGERVPAATLWRILVRHPLVNAMDRAEAESGFARLALTGYEEDAARLASEVSNFEEVISAIVEQLAPH